MTSSLNPVVHELVGLVPFVRNRLRCPHCRKIGTYKPHGGKIDKLRGDRRPVRRWLCKWCGWYKGPEGVKQAYPSAETGAWSLEDWDHTHDFTPENVIYGHYGRPVNPWAG